MLSYDFGFCFVAVSRRLVYDTTEVLDCQHLFCNFFNVFRDTLGSVGKKSIMCTGFYTANFCAKFI